MWFQTADTEYTQVITELYESNTRDPSLKNQDSHISTQPLEEHQAEGHHQSQIQSPEIAGTHELMHLICKGLQNIFSLHYYSPQQSL